MPRNDLEKLSPEQLIALARSGNPKPAPWRLAVGGQYDGDTLTMTTELEDGTVVTATYALGADGVVRPGPLVLAPPPDLDLTDTASWLTRHVNKAVSDAFQSHLYSSTNWLGLTDGFKAGLNKRQPGRRGLPLAELALLVQRYLAACEKTTQPMELLLTHEYHGLTKDVLNGRLKQAAKKDLIVRTGTKSRAGGEMTDRCRRVLAGEEG